MILKGVITLDLAWRLKREDVDQNSIFYWVVYGNHKYTHLTLKAGKNYIKLFGDDIPEDEKKLNRKFYSAFMSHEIKECLRKFKLKIVSYAHKLGKKSPYVVCVWKNGKPSREYPIVLENTEAEGLGLMLKLLITKEYKNE